MAVKVDRIEKNQVALEITVAAPEFQKSYEVAYKQVAGKVNVPGFRKGKAPRAVVEARVGKEAILEEAYEIAIPKAYTNAVDESGIEPVDRPQVEVVSGDVGSKFVFKATVVVKPEVELGQYKGFGLEKPEVKIEDEQVENQLKSMQERHAKVIDIEDGTIENNDTATIDFEGFVNEEAFPGGKGVDYPLVIGSNSFIPGFEDQLVGAAIGSELDVKVTFPEEYNQADLAGKDAVFKVTVKGIKRKELSVLDDEFAKDVSDFETIEELKNDIRSNLLKTAEEKAEQSFKNDLMEKAVENAKVDIPPVMVEQRSNEMLRDLAQRLQYQGLSFEQYLQYAGTNVEEMLEKYRPQAEKSVIMELVIEAIAKAEGIEASDEEINSEVEKFSAEYGQEAARFREELEKRGDVKMFTQGLVNEKTVNFLVANN